MKKIIFNGKFLSANMTGVHRVAEALLYELDDMANDKECLKNAEIFGPKNVKRQLSKTGYKHLKIGRLTGPLWEQLDLPRYTRKNILVNFCNLAPLFSRNSITMIHDAQVYLTPKSYSRFFLLWYKFALPTIGRRHAKILTVSEFSKSQLVKFGVAKADKIHVVHNGVDHMADVGADLSIIEKLKLSGEVYFCGLSNTQEHKNIKVLFNVMASESMRDTKLVLIGGTSREQFESNGAVIPDNVIFSGRVTDEEMRSLIEGALCYLFPSTTEGFGLPPLESMLLGTPAIVAPNGALPEVCGKAALYAAPDAPQQWIDAINRLIKDKTFRQKLSEQGVLRAKDFTWRRAAEKVLAVIEGVAPQAIGKGS